MQLKVDRRFRNGLMITNSYTFSRSKDFTNENTGIGTPIDFSKSWGLSNFNRTHNYVLTTIYDLPVGPGKHWLSSGAASRILGGWQLSTLFVAQSGLPLSVTASGTLLNTPGTTAYADLVGTQTILGGRGPGINYFDPSVYAQPALATQGNMSRNTGPEGPGFWQLDAALFKRFQITGSRYAEFRVDAFLRLLAPSSQLPAKRRAGPKPALRFLLKAGSWKLKAGSCF